jgi:hypothetical protein
MYLRFRTFNQGEIPTRVLRAWSRRTKHGKHLSFETPAALAENVRLAITIWFGPFLIGSAGVITARTKAGHGFKHESLTVVELGSDWVHKWFRGRGLGHALLERRIKEAISRFDSDWFVVCVTTNPRVQHSLASLGLVNLDPVEHAGVIERLCSCPAYSAACLACPFGLKAAWYLPR